MFDHIGLGATNRAATKVFFVKALEPVGVTAVVDGPYGLGLGKNGKPMLWFGETAQAPSPVHLAFTAQTRRQVDAFYHAALAAGGQDNGAPGLRPQYHASYYGAFVIGPDGHNVEVVCHAAEG